MDEFLELAIFPSNSQRLAKRNSLFIKQARLSKCVNFYIEYRFKFYG